MMSALFELEDFAIASKFGLGAGNPISTKQVEKDAFDQGYRDGWNDAFAEAQSQDQKARSEISDAIQEIEFTYFEARHHVMASFRPLLDAMMNAVLPEASKAALVPLVQQELTALSDMVEPPLQLLCAKENFEELNKMLRESVSLPIEAIVEETFASSQVQICYADGFSAIDTEATVKRIQNVIKEFFEPTHLEEGEYA